MKRKVISVILILLLSITLLQSNIYATGTPASTAPWDKATIKNHAVVYVVGAIVMFACTGILGIIKQFASVVS